ncbi:WYL domain-containing protein [Corynebacterium suedekumii]|nr:WYL domain-containing protein [Corynebacterium suedekumii]
MRAAQELPRRPDERHDRPRRAGHPAPRPDALRRRRPASASGPSPSTPTLLVRADATWLADYYPLELGQDRGDGMVEARMPVGSAEWFIRFVIGQSDRLTVTAPADLVEQVRHRAEAGLTAYDERPDR